MIPTDLADTGQIDRLVQAVHDHVGNLSALVNAAGSYASDSGADGDDHNLMEVNYHSAVRNRENTFDVNHRRSMVFAEAAKAAGAFGGQLRRDCPDTAKLPAEPPITTMSYEAGPWPQMLPVSGR